jgi:hypothetical protein
MKRPKEADIIRFTRTKVDTFALCMLVACGALYWFYMSINSSFWEPDEGIFAHRMNSGNPLPLHIHSDGRFYPLAHQEFNILGRFTSSPDVFHACALAPILLSAVFVWFVLFRLPWRFRIWPVLAILTSPSIFYISQSFIYPERNIILLLSVFVFCFCRFDRSKKKVYLFAALTAAFLSLFYKETVFLIFLGFSLTRGGYLYTQVRRELRLKTPVGPSDFTAELALIGCVLFFLSTYYIFTHSIRSGPLYDHVLEGPLFVTISRTLFLKFKATGSIIFTLSVIAYPVRIFFLSKLRFHPIWDSLLVAAFFFFAGNIILGRVGPYSYYSAPGDFLIILGTLGLLINSRINIHLITAIAVMIFLINLPLSIDYARAYKKLSFLHNSALSLLQESAKAQEILIFVDADSRWPYWGLAAALRLRGLNVEEKDKRRLLVRQIYETNSIRKNSHARDIYETVQEDPVPDEFVYVGFYTFWESFWPLAEPHQVTVRRYLEDVQHYIQVFPDSPSSDVDELSIYIFRKSIHTPT